MRLRVPHRVRDTGVLVMEGHPGSAVVLDSCSRIVAVWVRVNTRITLGSLVCVCEVRYSRRMKKRDVSVFISYPLKAGVTRTS